jgi:hypothetical protein
MLLFIFLLSACAGVSLIAPPPSITSGSAHAETDTSIPSITPLPAATLALTNTATITSSLIPSNSLTPTIFSPIAPATLPSTSNYVDDRSTPYQVIVSFYNAINRREYLRAYNYWISPSNTIGSYTSFAVGYADTVSVNLVFGTITEGRAMSQVYYTVPVILKATSTTGLQTHYAACYIVHAGVPDVFTAPPFIPMGIDRGSAVVAPIDASDTTVLATACTGYAIGSVPVPASVESLNIDRSNFVDNRSGPLETVSSLLNALNLRQYVRAYSYYQVPANFPGPYSSFSSGYADTGTITATFGNPISESAAGSIYYKLPVTLMVLTTTGGTQTFVGCYTLRLAQPVLQAVPPFQPMGIVAAKFNQVNNGANTYAQLTTACN